MINQVLIISSTISDMKITKEVGVGGSQIIITIYKY